MPRRQHDCRSGLERTLHWLLAASSVAMILSGIEIYRAAPFYSWTLANWPALGDDLATALLWHFAFAWALIAALCGIAVRRVCGLGLPLWPVPLSDLGRQLGTLRLQHDDLSYNPVQRIAYLAVFGLLVVAVFSGLAIWKPVQLAALTHSLGGYELARRVHFWTMLALGTFLIGHAVMALLVPRTIAGMLFGFRKE